MPPATIDHEAAWRAHLPAGVALDELDLLREVSLPRAWRRRWAAAPDAPVLWDADRGWTTAAELDAGSARIAGRLHAAGLRIGDRILVSAVASVDLVTVYVAALRLGLIVLPVNTAYGEREIATLVQDAHPIAAVVDDEQRGTWIRAASTGDVLIVTPGAELPDSTAAVPLDGSARTDAALLCYTSGTTGVPKGAVLTHGNLLANGEALRLAWRWDPADRLVLALPLFHMHGLGVGINGTLLAGASAVLLPRFGVDAVLDAAAAHDATLLFGVPTHYARLASSARVGELARLRLLVSGSAPLPAELSDRLLAATGQRVLERYGMTETVMNVSNPHDGDRRPGAVGLPLPGVEVRLDGGDPGEILLRGPNVFAGYWRRPDATAEAFDADGWFRTGDIGSFDPDEYLRIVGRSKELIISGGYNVYPREVEDVLRAHPAVADVAVVGRPSSEWGERVVAYVVPVGDEISADELLASAVTSLAPYKRPKEIHWLDGLPRNALGKVLRHELP